MSIATAMIRKALVRDLEAANLHDSPLLRIFKDSIDDEVPESLDLVERAPAIDPPGPYLRPRVVDISARLVLVLKRNYGPGSPDHPSRLLGQLPEVADWLATLKPGKLRPRTSA